MLQGEDIWRLILPLQSPECVGRWFPPEDDISVVETWFNRVRNSLVTSDGADVAQKEVLCFSMLIMLLLSFIGIVIFIVIVVSSYCN